MKRFTPTRKSPRTALKSAVGCVLAAGFVLGAGQASGQGRRQQMSAPIVRQAPPVQRPVQQRPAVQLRPVQQRPVQRRLVEQRPMQPVQQRPVQQQPVQPRPFLQQQQNRPNGYQTPVQPMMRPYTAPAQMGPAHQHLADWMNAHRNLTADQQQRALSAEPGFRQLQPAEQQRIENRLTQLNNMPPTQRERTLARTEAMERLAPAQRQQVRSALSDLGGLPEERRRAVARTFRELRSMPEGQRQGYLNSPQVRGQFSDRERYVLGNLVSAEPYLPPPVAAPR